jgi:hypothetical protein
MFIKALNIIILDALLHKEITHLKPTTIQEQA